MLSSFNFKSLFLFWILCVSFRLFVSLWTHSRVLFADVYLYTNICIRRIYAKCYRFAVLMKKNAHCYLFIQHLIVMRIIANKILKIAHFSAFVHSLVLFCQLFSKFFFCSISQYLLMSMWLETRVKLHFTILMSQSHFQQIEKHDMCVRQCSLTW